MKLVFDIVKNGKNIPSKRNFHFQEEGGSIGRAEDNDWVLTDTNSYISGVHAHILCKDGTYFIKDESTNGTFLKNPYKKLPKGSPIKINASDIFIIGDHELQARYSNNDYTQDDIISSFEDTTSDSIIPNNDFLFDSDSNGFTSVEASSSDDIEVMDMLEKTPSSDFPFTEVVLEEELEVSEEIDISDFITDETIDKTVPETEDETKKELFEEHINFPSYAQSKPKSVPKKKEIIQVNEGLVASVAILEAKLGITINNLEQNERDALMAKLGDVINTTLNSLQNSLQIKDKIKQDLNLSTLHLDVENNNPVKLGSAASKLLQNNESSTMLGMMHISEAIHISFNEIDSHSIALHSASKNIMNIAMTKFSPKNLEYRFESNGALRGILPKQQLLWRAYEEMFNNLIERPQEGVELIREEFKKEYENISYSLKLHTAETRKSI